MARSRRVRQDEVAGPPGPPVPPPWYRDIWPWLLALGLVVLGIIGGYLGYQAYQDDQDDEPEVVTVTTTDTSTDTDTDADTETTATETTTTTVEEPPEPVDVPDVVGQGYVEAGSVIEGAGLVADSYPVASTETRGTVVAQRPAGGQLPEGETVRNNVALGSGTRPTREVPDVTGPKASDARATLRTAGFTVRTQYRAPPSTEEEGEVLTQQPAPGTSAPDLTQVTIFVGRQ
jgi:eukaryotic-like serine/threonine-protein kinase